MLDCRLGRTSVVLIATPRELCSPRAGRAAGWILAARWQVAPGGMSGSWGVWCAGRNTFQVAGGGAQPRQGSRGGQREAEGLEVKAE